MNRRTYLAESTSIFVLGSLAGCAGETEEDAPSVSEPNETEDQDQRSANETNLSEKESDDEERVRLPEINGLDLEPGRLGPDEKIPRGVETNAILMGGTSLQDGENELRARVTTSSERQEPFSHNFTVTGTGDWTTFEEQISISTNPLLEGSYNVDVGLFDDELNADLGTLSGSIEVAAYNIRELENAEELLSEINELQREMAERYSEYGPGGFDEVPILTDDYSTKRVSDPLYKADSVHYDFAIDSPEVFDGRVDAEEAVIKALMKITYYHEAFRNTAKRIVSDLDLLRDLKFDEYDAARDKYPSRLDNLEEHHGELLSATDKFGEYDPPMDIKGRTDTFKTDLDAMRDLDLPLENLHSATEHILLGFAYSEENDSGRREARLDAINRIQSARNSLDAISWATAGDVADAVEELADDLEYAANEL
jgi:hypothetical protein